MVAAVVSSLAAPSLPPTFKWTSTPPLLSPPASSSDIYYSVKDPTIVSNGGRWHVFVTVRGQKRSHQVEYISFSDWSSTAAAERHFLQITNGYFCAPQVFYFTPHAKWYLLYQTIDKGRAVALQPAFSTAARVEDWHSWTAPEFLYPRHPPNIRGWIDFWIICDATRAHLFFTSNDGRMWRAEAKLTDFPHGWSDPQVVLNGDIFEASHTYRIHGRNEYLTIVEAQGDGRRYYKGYLADTLDGPWRPLATARELPFASRANVADSEGHWSDSVSHGELIRRGADEHMEINPTDLSLLFQGVLDRDMRGRKYGEIPWQIGVLRQAR